MMDQLYEISFFRTSKCLVDHLHKHWGFGLDITMLTLYNVVS